MILVFVIDTSPSMGRPAVGDSGMSRLDVAKMIVEDLSRKLRKRYSEHTLLFQEARPNVQRSLANLGMQANIGGDALLLLSTSRQHPDTTSCAAGGRLLVGFGVSDSSSTVDQSTITPTELAATLQHERMETFQRELKGLKVAKWLDPTNSPFPEDAGGAEGLNAALSVGLQLLSRYRLLNRLTENFGMGRLPNTALTMPNGSPASAALQTACLFCITDGACLRQPPKLGGGTLQLHFGSQPLREFYTEPFRWDQRIFVLGVGGQEGISSSQYLHPQLRALCDVTGGSHWMVRTTTDLQTVTDSLVKRIRPPLPRELPIPDTLYQRLSIAPNPAVVPITSAQGLNFVNGGPVCCFQAIEADETGRSNTFRAMLLYVGSPATTEPDSMVLSPPLWCIPESYFPSKKLDSLPPRPAQPLLMFSKHPAALGSKSFEPVQVIKMLVRLDQMLMANRKVAGQPGRVLHRDIYMCDWLNQEGDRPVQVTISTHQEYFPVFCRGAGRPSLSDDGDSLLNIGILHVPQNSLTLATQTNPARLATLTLLPPEPHILLPLLIRAAEAEHRVLKKAEATLVSATGSTASTAAGLIQKQAASIALDEHWRSELRAYLFRLPPYYQFFLKRSLRVVLPASAHSLLHTEPMDSLAMQCFSNVCMQKIRNAEQVSRENNELLERQEVSLKRRKLDPALDKPLPLRYGQYDPRSSEDSYLAALRNMPAPWRATGHSIHTTMDETKPDSKSDVGSNLADGEKATGRNWGDVLGDLPSSCLMAYYESRRRWIFGGPGLSSKGLNVEGINNGGSNSQNCGRKFSDVEECLLSVAGVGASILNQRSTSKMGEYKERLLFSRSPVVGSGSNDAGGVSATTAIDGSPIWSVEDEAMPVTFFDPKTGLFADSVQARVRSRLMVNFGNPFKEKRADSIIPERFLSQAPSMNRGSIGSFSGASTPPGSPPHESFESVEEGEAIFVHKSPSRSSHSAALKPSPPSSPGPVGAPKKPPPPPPPPKAPPPPKPSKGQPPKPSVPIQTLKPPPPPPPPHSSNQPAAAPTSTSVSSNQLEALPLSSPSQLEDSPHQPALSKAIQQQPILSHQLLTEASISTGEASAQVELTPIPATLPIATTGPSPPPPLVSVVPKTEPLAEDTTTRTKQDISFESHQVQQANNTTTNNLTQQQEQQQDLQNVDVKPNVNLPVGWICVWSKSQKRWYFFDTKTNKSVWKWPPPSAAAAASGTAASSSEIGGG